MKGRRNASLFICQIQEQRTPVLGRFGASTAQIERVAFDKLNGRFFSGIKIGSLVHKALAVPVSLIDAALGTDLQNCGDCAIREMKMNGLTVKM